MNTVLHNHLFTLDSYEKTPFHYITVNVDHLTVKYLNLLGFGIEKLFVSSWFILTLNLDSPSTSSSPNSPVWAQSREEVPGTQIERF